MSEKNLPEKPKEDPSKQSLWENFITISGFFLSVIAFILLFMFGLFSLVSQDTNPYVDIIGYLVVPIILVTGISCMPLGIFLKSWWRRRKYPEEHLTISFPRFDFNDLKQRRIAKYILMATAIILPTVALTSYHGYHYTDSSAFCAKACHTVMSPESTTYENSAHARVSCAECHIGSGASWFVKSKLSGTRQVFATLQNSFPRPIPPAITELRPARETCERCHWPQKFYGAQMKEIVRYASDQKNTKREINMLLKIGGGDETMGRAEGIHLHMALSDRIEYVATDEYLQDIPWVKMTDPAGNEIIYRSDGLPTSDPIPDGMVRQFDCMDCHNRPAHKFRSPHDAVDIYLNIGRIDSRLPFIKREAVRVLSKPYPDSKTADSQIGLSLIKFFQENYSEDFATLKPSIYQAVDAIREIFHRNIFPEMKVNSTTYPDNIGHLNSPGCFRCHDGKHVNQKGESISYECKTCHSFLNPLRVVGEDTIIQQGEFIHPMKMPPQHEDISCHQCHSGTETMETTCKGCHQVQSQFRQGTLEALSAFSIEEDIHADMLDCQDCHNLAKPTDWQMIRKTCTECHDNESLDAYKKEAEALLKQAEVMDIEEQQDIVELLRQAGPLHNLEATRQILKNLMAQPEEEPS